MSCEVNDIIREKLFEEYYETLIEEGLTSEQALKELKKIEEAQSE